MLGLQELISIGALPKKLNIVADNQDVRGCVITYEMIKSSSEEFQRECDKAIVIDNYQWIAISSEETSLDSASTVYSCDGKHLIGVYNRERRAFFQQEFVDNRLYTKAHFVQEKEKREEKEIQSMDAGIDLTNMDLNLGAAAPAAPATASTADTSKMSESQRQTQEIKEMLNQDAVQTANRDDIIVFNNKYGRLIAFIVKTDKGIKVSKVKVTKTDANGKGILRTDLTKEQLARVEEIKKDGSKNIPSSYYEKEKSLVFKESKPSAPVGVILSTPKGGDIEFTKLYADGILTASQDTTAEVKVLSMEVFYSFLAGLYDGKIKESEEIMGNRAAWLQEKFTKVVKENTQIGGTERGIRPSIALATKQPGRSTVLTTGNYIPLRKYVTMSQSEIKTADDVAKLQLNIEAALKQEGSYAALREEDRKIISEGGKTSEYFKVGGGKPITGVAKFDNKDEIVAEIRVPVRTKKPTKNDPNKFTYGFEYQNMSDDDATLYQNDKSIANILQVAGMSKADFLAKAETVTRRTSSSTAGKGRVAITASEFISAISSKSVKTGGLDARSIAMALSGVQAV